MTEITLKLQHIVDRYILYPWDHFRLVDILDWILLTVLFYCVYLLCRGRVAARVTAGLAVLWVFSFFAEQMGLVGVHRIIEGIAPFAVVLLAVIYQSELRDALARIGSVGFGKSNRLSRAGTTNTIHAVVDAACQIALTGRDGALIVMELFDNVDEHTDKGYPVGAEVTRELLCSIFRDRTPLHDGAVIIRNNHVVMASSKLPLRKNSDIVKGMGTRHRAAVGITDVTDCVVVVVSEESQIISVANHGRIMRDFNKNADELRNPETRKEIERKLRKTLSYLLLGLDMEDPMAEENGEQTKKKRDRLEIRFKLGFNLDAEDRERIRREREEEEAAREKFKREYKNRYKNMPTPDQYAERVGFEYAPGEEQPLPEASAENNAGMPSITVTPEELREDKNPSAPAPADTPASSDTDTDPS